MSRFQTPKKCGSTVRDETSGLRVYGKSHLNENKIPDLQDVGVVHVHKVGSISAPNPVVVDLSTGPTRALVAHLPKVVLCAER